MYNDFQKTKLRRELDRKGIDVTVTRYSKNDYGELSDNSSKTFNLRALFHKANTGSYVQLTTDRGSRMQSEKSPMLLTLYELFEEEPLQIDDVITFNNNTYKVNGWFNVEEANYAIDISMEEVQ